jgi:hypothetical protein
VNVSFLIAAGTAARPLYSDLDLLWITLPTAVLVGVVVGVAMHNRHKRRGERGVAESQRKAIAEQSRREQMHFEQGQLINQTGLKKMQLETQLLQTQVKIAEHELANRQRNDQINAVAVEKLRLEVESLKLHIREQHKRLDEFGSGFE